MHNIIKKTAFIKNNGSVCTKIKYIVLWYRVEINKWLLLCIMTRIRIQDHGVLTSWRLLTYHSPFHHKQRQ
jgi:hypothetical protein